MSTHAPSLPRPALDEAAIRRLRAAYADGVAVTDISKRFGVTEMKVKELVAGAKP